VSAATGLAAWLATYALHSTILLGVVWIATYWITSDRAREILWKAAITGSFLTSTIPAFAGFTPLVGEWKVRAPDASIESSAGPSSRTAASLDAGAAAGTSIQPSPPEIASSAQPAGIIDWARILVPAWLLIAFTLVGRLVFNHRRLFHALRDRTTITDGDLPGMLAELRRRAAVWTPVRLTSSPACPTPVALGRREICVPSRFIVDLDKDQQRSALAHELAHLDRRDPLWQLAVSLIDSVFFFQPLNRIGRVKLRTAAENLSDDWAVRQTGTPLSLARCLTQIGSWVGTAPVPDGMLAMAEGGSPLVQRIERLAEWRSATGRQGLLAAVTSVFLLGAVGFSAPVFSSAPPFGVTGASTAMTTQRPQVQSPDSVIVYRGPAASLEERWRWAMNQPVRGRRWIGWSVDAIDAREAPMRSGVPRVPTPDASAPTLRALVGERASPGRRAAIIVAFDGAGAREPSGARFQPLDDQIYLGGDNLLWLGASDGTQSLSRLKSLMASTQSVLRSELAAALSLHADSRQSIAATAALLRTESDPDVRNEAVQWLARLQGGDREAMALLESLTTSDRDPSVRVEAVDGLRLLMHRGQAGAREALVRIADRSNADMSVRSEAMQALTRQPPRIRK